VQDGGTLLWRLRARSRRILECIVRFARGGVEVEIASDSSPMITGFFTNVTAATAWAVARKGA
jgi:hypothetical protein